MKNLITLRDLDAGGIRGMVEGAVEIKNNPNKHAKTLDGKSLLMLFEMPSLRTRISLELAMVQLGGHAIYYSMSESTVGRKESVKDFAKVVSRYCDAISARVFSHSLLLEIAEHADVPVINALTNYAHPCQALADLLTIYEKKGKLRGIKLAYVGDANNNVTHSLLYACSKVGIDISIACPKKREFMPDGRVVREAKNYGGRSGARINVTIDTKKALQNADIVYTDTWMSYRINKSEHKRRAKELSKYRVDSALMRMAKKNAIFMHCLPAKRGEEVADEVMDGKNSVVYDQAENRLHMQKAILIELLHKK